MIAKDKKAITWMGMPQLHESEVERARRELRAKREMLERKHKFLNDLVAEYVLMRNLLDRCVCGD